MGKQKRAGRVPAQRVERVEAFEAWLRPQENGLLFAGYLSVGRIWIALDEGEPVDEETCQNALEAAGYYRDLAAQQGFEAARKFLEDTIASLGVMIGGGSWR